MTEEFTGIFDCCRFSYGPRCYMRRAGRSGMCPILYAGARCLLCASDGGGCCTGWIGSGSHTVEQVVGYKSLNASGFLRVTSCNSQIVTHTHCNSRLCLPLCWPTRDPDALGTAVEAQRAPNSGVPSSGNCISRAFRSRLVGY